MALEPPFEIEVDQHALHFARWQPNRANEFVQRDWRR